MFTTISWSSYFTAAGTILIGWYVYLSFRFYWKEIKPVLRGQVKIRFPIPGNQKNKITQGLFSQDSPLDAEFNGESFATLDEVKELSKRIVEAASESADRSLSAAEFKNYISLLLDEYPYVKISTLRTTVNNLIVSESKKINGLVLSAQEADILWGESSL